MIGGCCLFPSYGHRITWPVSQKTHTRRERKKILPPPGRPPDTPESFPLRGRQSAYPTRAGRRMRCRIDWRPARRATRESPLRSVFRRCHTTRGPSYRAALLRKPYRQQKSPKRRSFLQPFGFLPFSCSEPLDYFVFSAYNCFCDLACNSGKNYF